MVFEGTILYIGDVETVGQNGLQKRTFVVEEASDRQYKDTVAIDLLKDKVSMIDGYSVGETIKVYVGFRANLGQTSGKYFNSISAWKIEKSNLAPSTSTAASHDDLPF